MPYGGEVGNNIQYEFKIYQNYPNPFNPITNIRFSIPENNLVELKVFNVFGQEILNLVNEYKNAGDYIVSFDASNFPSGIYYYGINYKNVSIVKKMLLIK